VLANWITLGKATLRMRACFMNRYHFSRG